MKDTTRKKITLDLQEYLDDLLGIVDKLSVKLPKAILIRELDREEQYVHVEITETQAIVWRIQEWKTSYDRDIRKKVASEKMRQQYWLDDENVDFVSSELAKHFGIKDKNIFKPKAVEFIKAKGTPELEAALKVLGLEDLKLTVD